MATGMNLYIGSGRVGVHTFKENVNTKNGPMNICSLMVPVKTWKPGRDGNDGTETTMWFKMSAFGKQADYWHAHFDKGTYVNIQGNPEIETYMSENEQRISLVLNNPSVSLQNNQNMPPATEEKVKDPFFG